MTEHHHPSKHDPKGNLMSKKSTPNVLTRYAQRSVIVNRNRRGMIHEPNCEWLTRALDGDLRPPFVAMRANDVPSGKSHCSYFA